MKKLLLAGFVMALAAPFASADTYDDYPSIYLTNVQYGEYVMAVNGSNGCVATNENTTDAAHQFKLVPSDEVGKFYFYNVGTQTYASLLNQDTQAQFSSSKADALKFELTINEGTKFLIKNSANNQYFNCYSNKNVGGWWQTNTGSQWIYSLVNSADAAKLSALTANFSALSNLQWDINQASKKKVRILGGAFIYNVSQITSNAKHNGEGSYEALLEANTSGYPYFHSTWNGNSSDGDYHNLMFTFDNDDCKDFTFTFTPRPNNADNRPTEIHLYGSSNGGQTWEAEPFKILTTTDGLNPDNNNAQGSVTFTADKVYNALKFSVHATNNGQTPSVFGGSDSVHPFFTYGTVQLWRTGYTPTATDNAKANLIQAAIDNANTAISGANWADVYTTNVFSKAASDFALAMDDANGRALHPLFSRENLAKYPTVKLYNNAGRGDNHWMTGNATNFGAGTDYNAANTAFKLVPAETTQGHYYIYNVSTDRFFGSVGAYSTVFPSVAWNGDVAEFTVYDLTDGTRTQAFHNDHPGYVYNGYLYLHLGNGENNSPSCLTWLRGEGQSQWYVVNEGKEQLFLANLDKLADLDAAVAQARNYYTSIEEADIDQALKTALTAAINAAATALPGDGADYAQLIADIDTATNAIREAIEALKTNPAAALQLNITEATNTLNTLHGSHTTYNTPGYVPMSNAAIKALYDALVAGIAAQEDEDADLETINTAFDAALAAAAEVDFATAATCDISAGALYRIVNTDNRGSLYSKEDSPYVYSTGQAAYSGSADDDCMLWGVVEEKSQDGAITNYMLYNAGRKSFIYHITGIQGGYSNQGWVFAGGSHPAHITISENESKFPVVEILGHTPQAIHMGISNSYTAPLIHYYKADDGGVKFRFEYVRPDNDSAIGNEVFDALKSYADSRLAGVRSTVDNAHRKALANENWTVGFRSEEVYDAMYALLDTKNDDSFTYGRQFATIDNGFTTWYYAPRQMPEHDAVYTLESVHANHTQYIYNNNGELALAVDPTDVETNNKYRWHVQKDDDGKYTFSNYREVAAEQGIMLIAEGAELETTQLTTSGCEGAFTIEADTRTENYGCVNLKQKYADDESTRYLVTKNDAENPSFNRTTNLSADADYPGTFRLITVGSGADDATTTAISEVEAAGERSEAIYDLQGRRLAAPAKGVNIINGRKVLVK